MQFHLNGFRPGDPRAAEAAPDAVPGSVTLAAQLAAFADIHTCILEQKDGPPLVVGCDGARSAVRPAIGRQLVGDSANQAWGVMDLLAVTDFPDIRCKVAVQSAHANLLVIPREGGYLVRLDVEMDQLGEAERVASRHIGIDLEVKEVPWWSVYEMGQRICDKYDDVPAQELGTRQPRVFIAGDACHTHSPKAGQGMNFSMQDGFNLGWKLAAVPRGQCTPQLLRSYSAGLGTHYRPSLICGEGTHQHLATGFVIGTRFHSAPVLRLADARPMQLGHAGPADGRWRLYAFAGADDASLRALCDFLDRAADSPLHRHTPAGRDIDAVFDLRAVFQQEHREPAIDTLAALLRPRKGRYGLVDYEKVAHQAPASFFGGFMREAAP